MFGFACKETPEWMPLPISLAHRLTKGLAEDRQSGKAQWIRPDAKSQVSVLYEGNAPVAVTDVLVSTQHAPDVRPEEIAIYVRDVLAPRALGTWFNGGIRFHVNPTGSFVLGGPAAHCGVTGRKIIADTYGGAAHHGGGAFSGEDPSKVDLALLIFAGSLPVNWSRGHARTCNKSRNPGCLCDWCSATHLDQGGDFRHRQ